MSYNIVINKHSTYISTVLQDTTLFYVVQLKKERHERVKPILAVRKLVGCFESVKIPNKEEMLCVVIENIGRGHAFDISFDCLFGSSLERKNRVGN